MFLKNICLLSLLLVLLFPATIDAKEASIDENNLNVRSGPGTEYEQIGYVNQGEVYEILEENDAWAKIQLEGYEGWVIKEYITIQGSNKTDSRQPEQELRNQSLTSVTILKDGTLLRAGPFTDFDIVAFTEKGQVFDVLSETENWLEISNGELTGFVLQSHVESRYEKGSGPHNKTIVIDPGHGGRDVGAIGVSGSFEKDITYLTAHELERELVALGAEVILTRQEDEFVPLESRTTLANVLHTDAFLSTHYNSFPEVPTVTGIETFYYHDQYEELARFVHENIIKETNERDRGSTFEDFHVTRQTFKPGVLLELGFLSNETNDALLQTTGYQKKIVTGIINGLQKYFNIKQ